MARKLTIKNNATGETYTTGGAASEKGAVSPRTLTIRNNKTGGTYTTGNKIEIPTSNRWVRPNRGVPTDATAEEVSQMIYIGGLTPSSDGSFVWNGNWNEKNWRQMLKAYNGGFSFGVEREEDKSSVVPAEAYTGTAVQAGQILSADKQGRLEITDRAQSQKDAASGVMAGHIGDKATGWDAALNPYLDLVSAEQGVRQTERLSQVADDNDKYTARGGWSDNVIGQFAANFGVGDLELAADEAYGAYVRNPTADNLEYAQSLAWLSGNYQNTNREALDEKGEKAPWISKSFARYLPQLWKQTKARVGGAVAGGLLGSVVGATGIGAKAGAIVASGAEMHDQFAGAAYRSLIEAGVDEQVALEAAKDEAFIQSLMESGDTLVDILTLGSGGKIASAAGDLSAKALGKIAGTTGGQIFLKAMGIGGKVVLNALGEGAQEAAQQSASIANRRRNGTGLWDLMQRTVAVQGNALTGKDTEAAGEMWDAGVEGFKVGLLGAPVQMAGHHVVRSAVENIELQQIWNNQLAPAKAVQDAVSTLRDGGDVSPRTVVAIASNPNALKVLGINPEGRSPSQLLADVSAGLQSAAQQAQEMAMVGSENENAGSGVETAGDILRQVAEEVTKPENISQTAADSQPASVSEGQTGTDVISPNVAQRGAEGVSGAAMSDRQAARNMARVQESATKLGKNGSKALAATYDENMARAVSPEVAFAGFSAAYHSALTGKPLTKKAAEYVAAIPEQLRIAAEDSGRNDAIRARQAVYFGEDAELVEDNMLKKANLRSKDRRMLDAIAKNAGIKVRIVEKLVDERGYAADAQYKDGELLVSLKAKDPVRAAFTHDLVHRIRVVSPEAYTTLASFVQENMSRDNWNALVKGEASRYGERGLDYLSEEMVAGAFGKLMGDSALLDQFVRDNRKPGQIILDTIKDMIAAIKRVLKGQNVTLTAEQKADFAELQANLEGMSKALEKALKQMEADVQRNTKDGNKNTASEGGEAKYALRSFSDGVRFVDVQTDQAQFDGLSDKEKTKKAIQIIKQRFAGRIVGIDNPVFVNGRKAAEYGHPVKYIDSDIRDAKMRASTELDNLMDAGTNFRTKADGEDGHVHPDAVDDFQYYDVIFKVGNEYYKGVINIEIVAKGRLLKDITKIENITQDISSSYGENPKSTFLRDTSMNSIRKDSEKSNPKNSESKNSLTLASNPSTAELVQENMRLKERVEKWKGQTKRTTTPTLRQGDVDKLTRQIVKDYDGTLDWHDIAGDVKALGEFILRGGEELIWSEVKERAMDIGRKIVNSAQVLVDGELEQDLDGLKGYLHSVKLAYEDNGDIPDFNDWRKRHFGKFTISKGGLPVDVAYQELQEMFGEAYFLANITHPSDQLLHIAQLLDDMQSVMENPYSAYMEQAIQHAANDLIDRLLSDQVRQEPKTFADRQQEKLEKAVGEERQKRAQQQGQARQDADNAMLAGQMAQGRKMAEEHRRALERQEARTERVLELLGEVRRNRDAKIERIKEHNRQMAQNRRDRAADSKARTRLLKIAKRLQNKKLPAVSRALLAQYIGELDTVAKSLTDGKANDLRQLRDWYEDQRENNPDFIADPRVEKAIARLSRQQIADLSADEVVQLTEVLLNIENEIRTQRKLIDSEDRRDVYNMGVETIGNIEATKGNDPGLKGAAGRYIVTQTLSPVRQMRRMIGYADSDPLYRLTSALADGQRAMFDYQRRAGEKFLRWTQDKTLVRKIAGKDAEAITITGLSKNGAVEVEITPAMRMSLYLHSLNDQNLRHIAGGGITVPNMKLYRKGKIAEAYARGTTVKLTPSQIRRITGRMSAQERAFAVAAHAYFNDMSQKAINEVSEKLKGYSLAGVENYFPINTDTSFTKKEFDAIKFDGTIEGMGFLKERVDSAAPIMLRDMNAVLTQSIDQTAKYVGLAIPVRNFNKVWGVTKASYNEDGSRNSFESSVQQTVKQVWGENGYRYIEKMMKDLNGDGMSQDEIGKLINKAKSNYAGAVLTLSASVALKQAASYPTAAAVVGFKPLARALTNFGRVDMALINKYTPLQWYRTQGFSTQELGDMAKRDKSLPKLLNWVQGIDLLTTRKLWKVAEYYVRQENKMLGVGTDAYYQAVADVYNRIIEETQPNYTTMQRPQLLRSDNALIQSLQMFKTQPFQNFNVLYDALGNWSAKRRQHTNLGTQESLDALKDAHKAAVWAVTSQIVQTAVFAGMTLAWNAFRGKLDKYEDDEEDEVTLLSLLGGLVKDMLGGTAAMIPFGSDLWELVSSKVFGDEYYGMDAVALTAISDTIEAFSGTWDLIVQIAGDVKDEKEVDWHEVWLKVDDYFDDISKLFGLPYESVMNLFNACVLNGAKAIKGEYVGSYIAMKLTTSPEKYSKDYFELLYKAYKNDRAAYKEIYRDMVQCGLLDTEKTSTKDRIESNIERRKKEDRNR